MGDRADFQLDSIKALKNEPLARYTAARIGGPVDWLVVVESIEALIEAAAAAEAQGLDWYVLGSGSNMLVADNGVRGLVIINRAKATVFKESGAVYAEAGASLSTLARSCIRRGLAGLEWAVSVPGTIGGAVVGNAGAHGGDIAGNLRSATILERDGTVSEWKVEQLAYGYRDSALKRTTPQTRPAVLAAEFTVADGDPSELTARAEAFTARRKATQPPGASIGSMFKNPPGEYAGRLIEAAGLKGTQVGGAQISPIHANFFVNTSDATAQNVKALIDLARETVQTRFGILLELEIELVGDW